MNCYLQWMIIALLQTLLGFGFQISETTFGEQTDFYSRNASFNVNGFTFSAWVPPESAVGNLPFMIPTVSSSPSTSPTPSTTSSMSSSPTSSKTPTLSPSVSNSISSSPSATIYRTEVVFASSSFVSTSPSITTIPIASLHATQTSSLTISLLPSATSAKTISASFTPTMMPSQTTTPMVSSPRTPSTFPSISISVSPSSTVSSSSAHTPSPSRSSYALETPSLSTTPTMIPSQTTTPTVSASSSLSTSPSVSISVSPSSTVSSSSTHTPSSSSEIPSVSTTPTLTPSLTISPTASTSSTVSSSPSVSISVSPSSTVSSSSTHTPSPSSSASETPSLSTTPTKIPSQTTTPTVSPSCTVSTSPSASISVSPSSTVSSSSSVTSSPTISPSPSNSPCSLVTKVDSIDRRRHLLGDRLGRDGDYGYFGDRVSISRSTDSGYIVVSEPYTTHENFPGKVYVISTIGNNLVELNPENNQFFGERIAVSSDGRWIAASQYRGNYNGFVKIFDSKNEFKAYNLEFVPNGDRNEFGKSLSFINDIEIAVLVGKAKKEEDGDSYGAVCMYSWKEETLSWEKSKELWADDNVPRILYEMVASSEYVVASGYPGTVIVFELTGALSQSILPIPQGATSDYGRKYMAFGNNLLYVTDPRYNSFTGRVYVFDASNSFGLARVLENEVGGRGFGMAIDAAGDFVIVGAHFSSQTGELLNQGAAYIFDVNDNFNLIQTFWGEEANDRLGEGVAIASDGRYVIGATEGMYTEDCEENGCNGVGAVYLSEAICSLKYENILTIKD